VADNPDPNAAKREATKRGEVTWSQGLVLAGLALTIPGLLFGPAALGYWLDLTFKTDPWLTLTGFVVGLIATAIDIWQILRRMGLAE
jgi:F0F1-type ATP synthase assembly protein I